MPGASIAKPSQLRPITGSSFTWSSSMAPDRSDLVASMSGAAAVTVISVATVAIFILMSRMVLWPILSL